MSKKLTFKGSLAPASDAHRIKLSTIKGKTGYRINKFQIIPSTPGAASFEFVVKIFKKDSATTSVIDFTDSNLLAVAYYQDAHHFEYPSSEDIIFDNEIFNQDIYITCTDVAGGSIICNYFLQLETIALTDTQSTQLTLKSLRAIASR